jgi:protein-S-isoprenylcysteine O-methyltransferase Ste14
MSYAVPVVAALIALEVLSRAASARFLRRYHEFPLTRWALVPAAALAVVIVASFLQHVVWDSRSVALLAGGSTLFLVGWTIRYPAALASWMHDRLPRLRPVLPVLPRGQEATRHPRYVGLWAQAMGVAVSLSSWVGAALALTIVPVALWVAVELEERRVMARIPHSGLEYERARKSAFWPGFRRTFRFLGPPLVVTALAAVLSREVEVFVSDVDTAKTLLLALAGAQGTLGVLLLTATFTIGQLVTTGYSAGVAQAVLWRRPLVFGLVSLALSVSYDVLMVARADSWLSDSTSLGRWVDFGLLLGLLTVLVLWVSTTTSFQNVQPEVLLRETLRRFDDRWLARVVKEGWRGEFGPRTLYADDPMRHVEGILRALVSRNDLPSARLGLILLRDRLASLVSGDDVVAVDAYLNFNLRHVFRAAASTSQPEVLEGVLDVIGGIPAPSGSSLKKVPFGFADGAPGEEVVRSLLDCALESRLEEVAVRCIHGVGRRAISLLKELPDEAETYALHPEFDPLGDSLRDLPEEERRRRSQNDDFVHWVGWSHMNYLASSGSKAISAECIEAAYAVCMELGTFAKSAATDVSFQKMRASLVSDALYGLITLADAAAVKRARGDLLGPMYLGGLEWIPDDLDPSVSTELDLMMAIVDTAAYCVKRLARAGVLHSGVVIDVAMVGLHAGQKRAEAAKRIVESMREAAEVLKSAPGFEEDGELQRSRAELLSRIGQVGMSARGEGSDEVRELTKQALKELEGGG